MHFAFALPIFQVQYLLEENSKAKVNNGKSSAVEILNSYVVRERAKVRHTSIISLLQANL